MKITIIGTGLIGGSMALALRERSFADIIVGVEPDENHAKTALELGIVDRVISIDEAIRETDVIIVSIPVDATEKVVPQVLSLINKHQVVMDVGSNKKMICDAIAEHEMRGRFVATHPMWGTEYSGPAAATKESFRGNAVVICNREQADEDALAKAVQIYDALQMKIVYMDAEAHDIHAAYVSHISHITSFALANTVLEKEKEESAIFEMASGGFESTVRLAKSNPDMWLPIFRQNRENVLDVLNEHIAQLKKFRSCFEKDNYEYMRTLMENANKIKRIIK